MHVKICAFYSDFTEGEKGHQGAGLEDGEGALCGGEQKATVTKPNDRKGSR